MAGPISDFSQGVVTARDPSTLHPGELSEQTAGEYRPGSPHLYKQPGRSTVETGVGSGNVQAIHKLQYDTGTDVLAALSGGTMYESSISTDPTFASVGLTGLSTTAAPTFSSMQDRWIMCNGVDSNYIREPAAPPGGSSGNWRPLGLQTPPTSPTITMVTGVGTGYRPNASASNTGWNDPTLAYDTDTTTYAYASLATTNTITYSWAAQAIGAGFTLYILYQIPGAANPAQGQLGPAKNTDYINTDTGFEGALTLKYSVDSGVNYTTIVEDSSSSGAQTVTASIPTGNLSTLRVQAIATSNAQNSKLFDIRVTSGSTVSKTITNPIDYGYTEKYTDSDGLVHESSLSPIRTVSVATFGTAYGATLTLGPKVNSLTSDFLIYRSIDEAGGGYPTMYQVGSIAAPAAPSTTTWTDDFSQSLTIAPSDGSIYQTLDVLYYTSETLSIPINDPPPKSTISAPFQSCMCYVPVASPRRLAYSLPASTSAAALEQVPSLYFLEFQTPKNDSIISIASANGGNSLLVFFEDYTMIVSMLPQATDPGVFDNRVKEYVSNSRGTAGILTIEEFTLPSGETLIGSVDSLGLWITNGFNRVEEWSKDLNWNTLMAGVNLSTGDLRDNTELRRLEFLYTDANSVKKSLHFYYGRMKQDNDGGPAPLITGPHPRGFNCISYFTIGGKQYGMSGGTEGQIYLERGQASDASQGYDATGIVPFSVTTGDTYLQGLPDAHLIEEAYVKFGTGSKDFSVIGTFLMDKGVSTTSTKTFSAGSKRKIYWHKYCDRHRVQITDLTNTSMPELIAYSLTTRDAGPGRDI